MKCLSNARLGGINKDMMYVLVMEPKNELLISICAHNDEKVWGSDNTILDLMLVAINWLWLQTRTIHSYNNSPAVRTLYLFYMIYQKKDRINSGWSCRTRLLSE